MTEQVQEIPEKPAQSGIVPEMQPQRNSFKVVLLVVLGFIVLAGAVYAGITIGKKQSPPKVIPQVTEVSPAPDPTANWKNCTDTARGFTMKYPSNFELNTGSCNYAIMNYSLVKDINVTNSTQELQKNWLLEITSEDSNLDVEQWIQNNKCPDNTRCSTIRPGPISGSLEFDLLNVHYAESDVILKVNGTIFDFSLNARNPNNPVSEEIRSVFHQILSTFKFLP